MFDKNVNGLSRPEARFGDASSICPSVLRSKYHEFGESLRKTSGGRGRQDISWVNSTECKAAYKSSASGGVGTFPDRMSYAETFLPEVNLYVRQFISSRVNIRLPSRLTPI